MLIRDPSSTLQCCSRCWLPTIPVGLCKSADSTTAARHSVILHVSAVVQRSVPQSLYHLAFCLAVSSTLVCSSTCAPLRLPFPPVFSPLRASFLHGIPILSMGFLLDWSIMTIGLLVGALIQKAAWPDCILQSSFHTLFACHRTTAVQLQRTGGQNIQLGKPHTAPRGEGGEGQGSHEGATIAEMLRHSHTQSLKPSPVIVASE